GPWDPRRAEVASGTRPGLLRRPSASSVDQRVDLVQRQVVVKALLVAHHGCVFAGTQALDLLHAEQAVRTDLLEVLHAGPPFDVITDLHRAPQRAREVGADVEVMPSGGLQVEERVEGRNAFHVARIQFEQLSHFAHHVRGQVSQLFLRDIQRGYDSAAQLWKTS